MVFGLKRPSISVQNLFFARPPPKKPSPPLFPITGCGKRRKDVLPSVSDPDPYSIGPVAPDPDSYSESGSGSRMAKMTHKSRKNSCFEVLDGLFCELQASSVTWTYFIEA